MDIQEQSIFILGGNTVGWNVYFWGGFFVVVVIYFKWPVQQLLPFAWDFIEKGWWLVWIKFKGISLLSSELPVKKCGRFMVRWRHCQIWIFLCFNFWVKNNNKTCWLYKNNVSAKLQNTKKAETFILCLSRISVAVHWDHMTVTSLGIGFHREWIAAGLGPCKLAGCSAIHVLIQQIQDTTCYAPYWQ